MATLNIKDFPDRLYRRVKKVAEREHRSVAQQVIHILSRAVIEPPMSSILELRGLGKEIWAGIDPAKHVRDERESWD